MDVPRANRALLDGIEGTENPRVGGSIPPLGTSNTLQSHHKPWQRESAQYSDRASAYRIARDFPIVGIRQISYLRSTEEGMLNHWSGAVGGDVLPVPRT